MSQYVNGPKDKDTRVLDPDIVPTIRTSITRPSSWDFGVHPLATEAEIAEARRIMGWNEAMQQEETAAKIAASTVQAPALSKEFPTAMDNFPLTFGKYKGKSAVEIAVFNPYYLLWCKEKAIENVATPELLAWCERVTAAVPQNNAPKGKLKREYNYGG